MKKFLLIFTLVGSICSRLGAQSVFLSDLQIDISEQSKEEIFISDEKADYLFFYLYPVTVTQTIYLSDFEKDTLILYLENTSIWNPALLTLFFNDMTVMAKKGSQEPVVSLPFDFNGDSITIIPPAPTCEINIRFQYPSDFCMRNDSEETTYFLQAQMYFQHSWYFTHPDMKLDKACFRVPDNDAYFFVQSLKQKTGNLYEADVTNLKENDISFYLLNKAFYEKVSFREQAASVHLFLARGVKTDSIHVVRNGEDKTLWQVLQGRRITNELIDRSKQKIKKILQQAIQVFNYKDAIEINICEGYLALVDEKGKRYNWGCAMPCADNSHFLLIDTSHWALTHEMLHPFNKYEPVREDSSYFFFHESIIEYLTVCFEYEDVQITNKTVETFNKRGFCTGNTQFFYILPDGKITFCEQMYWSPNFIIGNITNMSIMEFWDSDLAKNFNLVRQKSMRKESKCYNCKDFKNCHFGKGICWKMIVEHYGNENWDFPDPRCPKAPPSKLI